MSEPSRPMTHPGQTQAMTETCTRCGHTGSDVSPARELRGCMGTVHRDPECSDYRACARREYGPRLTVESSPAPVPPSDPLGIDHARINSWGDPDAIRALDDAYTYLQSLGYTALKGSTDV